VGEEVTNPAHLPTNVRMDVEKNLLEQVNELKTHENALLMRLSAKEHEVNQLHFEV
jgi:hypothetical protein